MKIVIDEKTCHKHKMTVQELLIALAVRMGKFEDCIENLVKREILVDYDNYQVTQHWSGVMDEILCDSVGTRSAEELMKLAERIKECFPKMAQPDRYGRPTKYYFRCNTREIMLSLKRFYQAFGESLEGVTDDDIVDATKRYVASFKGNYQGMRLAKYFIIKNPTKEDINGKGYVDQISDLMTFLENKEDEGVVEVNTSDEWLTNSRN